jgi:hypothetical protein
MQITGGSGSVPGANQHVRAGSDFSGYLLRVFSGNATRILEFDNFFLNSLSGKNLSTVSSAIACSNACFNLSASSGVTDFLITPNTVLDDHLSGYYAWSKASLSKHDKANRRLTGLIELFWLESGCEWLP